MNSSRNDLLSIKEFSRLTSIKQSTLRYYDGLGLFCPAKRGENGYRYYTPQQTTTINSISLLHELGMPIRQLSEIQANRSPELMLGILTDKEESLEAELIHIERSYNVVRTFKRMIQIGLTANEKNIEVRFFEEMPIVVGPVNDFDDSDAFYHAFYTFCSLAKQYRIDLRLPVGGMFQDFDTFVNVPSKPTNFFSVDPKGLDSRPAGMYVSAFNRGYYGETGDLLERIENYIRDNGLKPVGPVYNIFLHNELSIDDPANYLLHATVRVA